MGGVRKGYLFHEKWYIKGYGVGPRGGVSTYQHLLSSPPGARTNSRGPFYRGYQRDVFISLLGNFSYFWIKKDYSLFRLLRMMFRLNFLVFMVMAVTRNEFVRYYVCAMHTYWFITVYVMLAVFKSHNEVNNFLFLVNKHDYR